MTEAEDRAFRKLCREYMNLPMEERIKRGFRLEERLIPGDKTNRAFETMAEYRAWCEANLPGHLGFKRALTVHNPPTHLVHTDNDEVSMSWQRLSPQ
jgi:hypothetical protein